MHVQTIEVGTPLYGAELALRDRILRQPLGLSLFDEDLSLESTFRHFVLCDEQALLACVVYVPLSEGRGKLKQMAVDEAHQGKGLGRLLMNEVEMRLKETGVRELELAARITARRFYETLGYRCEGEVFTQVGIPHIKMIKKI